METLACRQTILEMRMARKTVRDHPRHSVASLTESRAGELLDDGPSSSGPQEGPHASGPIDVLPLLAVGPGHGSVEVLGPLSKGWGSRTAGPVPHVQGVAAVAQTLNGRDPPVVHGVGVDTC